MADIPPVIQLYQTFGKNGVKEHFDIRLHPPVILSERSESKDLRIFLLHSSHSVPGFFDSLRKSSIFFSRSIF